MADESSKKEPLLAKIKRKTVNAGHATRLGAYKTKKNAQIQALKFKVTDRKKQYGVDYMNLVEENASQSELQACFDEAMRDLALLQAEIEKHMNKIDLKEETVQEKIVADAEIPAATQAAREQQKHQPPPEGPRRVVPASKSGPSQKAVQSNTRTGSTNNPRVQSKDTGAKPSPVIRGSNNPGGAVGGQRPVRANPVSPMTNNRVVRNPVSPKKNNNIESSASGKSKKDTPNVRKRRTPDEAVTVIDNSKWKISETTFSGAASYITMGKQEVVKGKSIPLGIKMFKENPDLYTAMYYQTTMVDWQPEKHQYTLIHREGTDGYTPKGTGQGGWMTLLIQTYERLPRLKDNVLPKQHRDEYTDSMTFNRKKLHSKSNKPLLPGRGMGVADVPDLKIIGDVDPSDIHQGMVGDCWLLSGISALAEFDGAVKKLFRKTKNLGEMPFDNKPNLYTITLWDLTTWKEVDIVVDERLCAAPNGQLLASKPSEDGELWVCYIEKAVAAHCGGWDKLVGGQCTHAWSLLTGCKEQYMISKNHDSGKYVCHGKYNSFEKRWAKHGNSPHEGERGMWRVGWPKVGGGGSETLELNEDQLFARLVAWDKVNYIVGAGTKGDSDKSKTDGLVDNHAYSVIESHDNVAGTKIGLLKVRNPWGKGEIEDGEFDDDGPGWDRYPQIKRLLKPVVADDGIFWVTKQEFFQYFNTIYLSASNMTEFLED